MQRLIRALCLWLALLLTLCVAFCGCEEEGTPNETENTSETGTTVSDVSVRNYEKLSASALVNDLKVGPWLRRAMEREQVTNALLCPVTASNGSLHCYLYVGAFCEGDSLAFGVNPTDGTLLIRHTAADVAATGSPYVFSFWIDAEELPNVEIFQNDVSTGLVISYTGAQLND